MQIEIKITKWSDDSRADFILCSEHAKSGFKVFQGNKAKQIRQLMIMLTETFYESATIDFLPDEKTDTAGTGKKNIP